jgi:hypothetical protein
MSAALTIRSSGIVSNVLPPVSRVRQGRSPQTEQHGLLPTLAPSHSSIGLPAIQIRFDSDGSALKACSSSASVLRTGWMPSGRSAASSLASALRGRVKIT